jgi:hypothetical protein
MRATERLLELIAERARLVDEGELLTQEGIMEIRQAVDELRRRGDTLVTGRDLELIIQALARESVALGEDEAQALGRLDGALGSAP